MSTGDEIGEFGAALDDVDTATEVEAAFRSQRRAALGWFALFCVAVFGVPAATALFGWWSTGELVAGMSPAFLAAAMGLYLAFVTVAVVAARAANQTEERMLGRHDEPRS